MITKPKTSTASTAATTKRKSSGEKDVKVDIGAAKNILDKKVTVSPKKRSPRKQSTTHEIHPVVRHQLIELTAYYLSEQRGFHGGCAHDDWLRAEQEIDAMIAAGKYAV